MHLSFSRETNVAPNRYVFRAVISRSISRVDQRDNVNSYNKQRSYSRISSKKFILFSLSLSFSLFLFMFRIIFRLSFRSEVQSIKFIKVWKTSFCLILLLVLLCINISCSYVVALLISYRILFSLAALTR